MRDLVDHYLEMVPLETTMADTAAVARYDRYQASAGIEAAASLVAERAAEEGLADVTVERHTADGAQRAWWSFQAPRAWTPEEARFEAWVDGERRLAVDHAEHPFSVATYAAATPPGGVVAPLVEATDAREAWAGAVVIVGPSDLTAAGTEVFGVLAQAGAVGFVTDATCRRDDTGAEWAGRIELDPDTPLWAFSLTSHQIGELRTARREGGTARVTVAVDRSATMPVVSATLVGDGPEEVWVTSHLCHPRPGANDNATGVAALLGAAAALQRARPVRSAGSRARSVRFVWGPEFVGTAAFLHARMGSTPRSGALPTAVVNLDMVGEDQARCGGPFVVERNCDRQPSVLAPLAEGVVAQVFAATRRRPGRWRSVPFTGFSDHALFADPWVGRPAVHFCHTPDRYNHSAADSLDKVSPTEMLRSTAAAATLVDLLATDEAHRDPAVAQIVHAWCRREEATARAVADRHREAGEVEWSRQLLRYVKRRNDAVLAELVEPVGARSPRPGPLVENDGQRLIRCWSGPVNIRALVGELSAGSRAAVSRLVQQDKGNLALLLNLALRVDGTCGREQVVDEASWAWQRPPNRAVATVLVDALVESGWVAER